MHFRSHGNENNCVTAVETGGEQHPTGVLRSNLSSRRRPRKKITDTEWCLLFFGAGDEARTRYLHLGKVALYRMSYARVEHIGL